VWYDKSFKDFFTAFEGLILSVFNNHQGEKSGLSTNSDWNFMIEVLVLNMDVVFNIILLQLFVAIIASSYFPLRKKYNNAIHAVDMFERFKELEKSKRFKKIFSMGLPTTKKSFKTKVLGHLNGEKFESDRWFVDYRKWEKRAKEKLQWGDSTARIEKFQKNSFSIKDILIKNVEDYKRYSDNFLMNVGSHTHTALLNEIKSHYKKKNQELLTKVVASLHKNIIRKFFYFCGYIIYIMSFVIHVKETIQVLERYKINQAVRQETEIS
jgi:hypothetical protein